MIREQWRDLLIDDTSRLEWLEEGIVIDRQCAPSAQDRELEVRDQVAAPFVQSTEAAVKEAARHHMRAAMLRRVAAVMRGLNQVPADRRVVVDAGCGFGWHWIDAARAARDTRFLLIDFSAMNLRVCRELLPLRDYPNVLCIQTSATDLPLRDGIATLYWSVQVFQHLRREARKRAFAELKRVLAAGGSYYLAWIRPVPAMRLVYALFGRKYHVRGDTPYGLYLDRFDESVEAEVRNELPGGHVTRSESLFHPELRLRPRATSLAAVDAILSTSPLGKIIARQAEYSGRK